MVMSGKGDLEEPESEKDAKYIRNVNTQNLFLDALPKRYFLPRVTSFNKIGAL